MLKKKTTYAFFCCALVIVLISTKTFAQAYPFTLPNNVSATLDVDTRKVEVAKNKLLGYNYWRFKSNQDKELARMFNPISVRFSEGNFYNWQTDGFNNDSYDNLEYEATINQYISSNTKWGYGDMLSINKELKLKNGFAFDILFNFSVGFTTASSNVDRLRKYTNDGLKPTDIEIGNEYFWKIFRNNATAEASDQVILFKELAEALHQENHDLKISIPLGWRTNQVGYNATIMGDKNYFDAITIHKYVGADPDVPGESDVAYSSLLTARLALIKDVDFVRNQAPGKPVWLTEWNVDGAASGEWAAALGATDIYLYMFENQNIYHRSCWFSAAAAKNPFVLMDPIKKYDPKYPLEKTISGAMYEIVQGVFKNAEMYNGILTTIKLTTPLGSIDAINARVVNQDGQRKVIAVNLTNQSVDFIINIDGVLYVDSFTHKAMYNRGMDDSNTMEMNQDPLELVKKGSGQITLPPLSINVITLGEAVDNTSLSIKITAPIANAVYKLGDEIPIAATASSNGTIQKVNFKIDDVFYEEDLVSPYETVFTPTKTGAYKISARVFSDFEKEDFVFENVVAQAPFKATAIQIPGTIEAEDYDKGGEDLSYKDNNLANLGGSYRSDGVDIGTTPNGGYCISNIFSGEWVEYTVNVTEGAVYYIDFVYASKLTTGKIGMEFFDENKIVFTNFPLTQTATADWNTYETKTKTGVPLIAGIHILRVNMVARGFNLDRMVFKKTGELSVDDNVFNNKLKVYPVPSANGHFNLSETCAWEVYSLLGVKISEGKSDSVNISNVAKGMYFLKTNYGTKRLVYK